MWGIRPLVFGIGCIVFGGWHLCLFFVCWFVMFGLLHCVVVVVVIVVVFVVDFVVTVVVVGDCIVGSYVGPPL